MTDTRSPYIEVECPHCIADFDLEVMDKDARWQCLGCGAEHRLGDVGQLCIPSEAGSLWLSEWKLEKPDDTSVALTFKV